jgi:hypothetical protein
LIYADGSVIGLNTLVTFDKDNPDVGVKYYALGLSQVLDELMAKAPEELREWLSR